MGSGSGRSAVARLRRLLAEAVEDGALVGLGGGELERKPMATVRALVELGRRDLRVATVLGSADVELLLASGCVAEIHAAGVALEGLAPRWREARQSGSPRVVEWSEGTYAAALQAAALGADSMLWPAGLGTDLPAVNPCLKETADPHTGARVLAVRALLPDVTLVHVNGLDEHGNAYVEGDLVLDGLLARASRQVIATYERAVPFDPPRVAISRIWIGAAVEAPRGAWPTGCRPLYDRDRESLTAL